MATINVNIAVDDNTRAQFRKYEERAKRAFTAGVRMEMERVMAVAKGEYVPVQYGNLRGSGRVHPVKVEGERVTVDASFGGTAAPYAIAVHEIPPPGGATGSVALGTVLRPRIPTQRTARHRVGQWKYLEQPLLEAAPGMERRIGALVKAATGVA